MTRRITFLRARAGCIAAVVCLVMGFAASCEDKEPVDVHEVVDPCAIRPCSVEAVVMQLETSYETLDYPLFEPLLHPEYLFYLTPDPLNPGQPSHWGRTEELRIHRRLFNSNVPPSEDPVPVVDAIHVELTPIGSWLECSEYYESPTNPDGLDSTQVAVFCADYHYSLLVELQGATDYSFTGQTRFVVARDRIAQPTEPGAITLYRWYDWQLPGLGGSAARSEPTWSSIKVLYQ